MSCTATEILLRQEQAARALEPFARGFERLLNQFIVVPAMYRMLWRVEMEEAMRATAFQLAYTPKD